MSQPQTDTGTHRPAPVDTNSGNTKGVGSVNSLFTREDLETLDATIDLAVWWVDRGGPIQSLIPRLHRLRAKVEEDFIMAKIQAELK